MNFGKTVGCLGTITVIDECGVMVDHFIQRNY